jgi:heme/copper-type cytochrome/quinol oxidase subunit 3
MRTARRTLDVSMLAPGGFGYRSLMWWGTVGFIIIEGTTLFICAVSYFYLRRNFSAWPPEHVFRPALVIPTIQAALMLLSNIPMRAVDRASSRLDVAGVRSGLVICSVLIVLMTVLRGFELNALNVRWDTNAYGSVAWAVLVAHGLVSVTDVMDTIGLWMMFRFSEPEEKHFVDTCENSQFWYFIVASWIPLFVIVFLYPRWTT